ncbi:phiSA1p31-related protein [Leifsonia sp. NPDC058292]|uniref:phiSA1p31-related protein n=1 Tax=Leifsonia sp. NPDC058292 TaxID=3346428 RepID=UPI0036D797FC
MTDLFAATEGPQDVAADECPCPNPDDQYLMEIDEGGVTLTHKACGKQPRGDYLDLVCLPQTPVTVKAEPYGNCDGREWHGDHRCDCGIYLDVAVNHLAVMHNDQPYLIGRDYADRDGEVWRISDLRDAQDQPLVYLLPEGAGEPGPIAEIDEAYGPLTLQPLTPKETTA